MAEKDREDDGPSLELPSFFGRRKKQTRTAPETAAGEADTTSESEPGAVATEPAPDPEDTAVVEPDPAPVGADPEPEPPVAAEPKPAPVEPVHETTVVIADPEPESEPMPMPEPEPAPVAVEPEPEPESTAVIAAPATEPEPEPRAPARERLQESVPELAASTAAFVVGAVIGLLGCGATWAALQGCELATGTDSCGGPGLLVLILIVVGMILLGAAMLRLFGVPEPGNVSFLGVAIMVAVALVFLISYLFEGWMFAVIPVLSALSFWLARWITTRWTDPGDEETITHDVR